jgi:hypothetical protein
MAWPQLFWVVTEFGRFLIGFFRVHWQHSVNPGLQQLIVQFLLVVSRKRLLYLGLADLSEMSQARWAAVEVSKQPFEA